MKLNPYVYCPYCGTKLAERNVFARVRPSCLACGFVHFQDPKVAVIGMVICRDHVLLVRRGVEPERGKWALPGGYMDAGEMPEAALRRELNEEVGLAVGELRLLEIFPMSGGASVHNRGIVLVYRAQPVSAQLEPVVGCDDVFDAQWFRAGELPDDLAFDSTITLLEKWQVQGWVESGT